MTNDNEQPCLRRIDADCFRAHPAWAKQAFAYRLVHLLTPKALTKRLPKGLRTALLAPGVDMPPGVEMPGGIVVAPGAVIPPGWTPGDPVPSGITIAPGTVFPPGWTPGDPIPEGVTLDPGATFPPGWTPGDPLPAGAIPAPTVPPGVEESGATPPTYVAPWEPGPINQPGRNPAPAVALWFDEPFSNLTANAWSNLSTGTGTATIVGGKLKLYIPVYGHHATIRRTHATAWPTNWTLEFKLDFVSGNNDMEYWFYTGTHIARIGFYPPDQFRVHEWWMGPTTWYPTGGVMGEHTWNMVFLGSAFTAYKDDAQFATGNIYSNTSSPGQMDCDLFGVSLSYTDYITIVEN